MPNRNFYVYSFDSNWLKRYKFNIHITFKEALRTQKVIALADNEMLRVIRRITKQNINIGEIDNFYYDRDKIKKNNVNIENVNKVNYIQDHIYKKLFISEYVVIDIGSDKDYDKMFQDGLFINDKKYVRASCSASQGRVKKVVFCEENVSKQLLDILDNGRDKSVPFSPSKFNAYLGCYSSATKAVSFPRICIIKDSSISKDVDCWWVTEEEDKNKDDIIERKIINLDFNLFDGNGLVSPEFAEKWSEELNLNYLPAQWCIRAPWIKGMVNVFDFKEFCKEVNNDDYFIKSIYGERVDLRDIDVIITESQFKLWSSYSDINSYIDNCNRNDLHWCISLYTPEVDKDILNLNYQFVQTLDLDKNKIEELCRQTKEWFSGVSLDNYWYTILFLMGKNVDSNRLKNFLKNSENNWLKSLIINKECLNDKYISNKVQNYLKVRIDEACMGRVFVDGNFQVIVPDSYAFMQHACGLEVTGLLNEGEYYSKYWVDKGVQKVDTMRSPLTYLSEHFIVDIKNSKEIEKWFKYSYTGFVCNVFGEHTLRWAGSD